MTSVTLDERHNLSTGTAARLSSAVLSTSGSLGLTILRVALGLVILPHGLQKTAGWLGGYGFSATMDHFVGMGIPAFLAFLAIAAESAGALALISGFLTRVGAFGIGVTMVVAGLMHRANGLFMNWSGTQKGEGFEYHILAVAIAATLVLAGAGRWSVDRYLTRRNA